MGVEVEKATAADYDRWEPNIEAWSNWDGTVTLTSECPIGRKSCVTTPKPPYDDCEYFMGVKDGTYKGCCAYILKTKNTA